MEIWRRQICFISRDSDSIIPGIQAGDRPGIVVSNDKGNEQCNKGTSEIIRIMPGSKVIKGTNTNQPTKIVLGPECGLKCLTEFSAEQTKPINIRQIKFFIGNVPEEQMKKVDMALAIADGRAKEFDADYILELIDDMVTVDRLFSAGLGMEEDYRKKVRREKEIARYCADYGFSSNYYLERYYYKRGVLCG